MIFYFAIIKSEWFSVMNNFGKLDMTENTQTAEKSQ